MRFRPLPPPDDEEVVVVEKVIPESQRGGNTDLATLSAVVGFAIMMSLDVALG